MKLIRTPAGPQLPTTGGPVALLALAAAGFLAAGAAAQGIGQHGGRRH